MGAAPETPFPLVVVARWFPAHDEPGRGAFVVSQIEAVRASGAASVTAITFEDVRLGGTGDRQLADAELVIRQLAETADDPRAVSARGINGPANVPVLRVRVPHFGASVRAVDAEATWHRRAMDAVVAGWPLAPVEGPRPRGIVHAHEPYPDGAAAVAVSEACGWPLILTEHASYVEALLGEPETRRRYLEVVARAHRLVVVSRTLAERLVAAAPELQPRITIIPNAIPTGRFPLGDPRTRRPDELLYVGARRVEKGMDRLLDSFALVRAARPSATLRLIGTAPLGDAEWEARAAALGIADAVRFEPAATPDAVAAAMREAGVFVHPSPSETFGVVAAEALATGLPVAATASGGVTEIVGAGAGPLGETIDWDGPATLAGAILRTLDRRDSFVPEALRGSIVDRFDAPVVAARLTELYREALQVSPAIDGGRVPPGPPAPSAQAPRRAVVLGLNGPRLAERLRGFPGDVDVVVGANTRPPEGSLPSAATVHVVDPRGWLAAHRAEARRSLAGRLVEVIRHGRGERAGRIHESLSQAATVQAVRAVAERLGAGWIVPVEGEDVRLAVGAATEASAPGLELEVAPGGLRWLADQTGDAADRRPRDEVAPTTASR